MIRLSKLTKTIWAINAGVKAGNKVTLSVPVGVQYEEMLYEMRTGKVFSMGRKVAESARRCTGSASVSNPIGCRNSGERDCAKYGAS